MRLPEGLSFKDIVDHAFIMNETLEELILGLNQIHLDLICNGTSSRYFVDILDTYGHIVGMQLGLGFSINFFLVPSIFLGIGVILSVTIFCAGQVYERSTLVERIHKLDLEKLKQKTEAKL